jgi:hypothetical protein
MFKQITCREREAHAHNATFAFPTEKKLTSKLSYVMAWHLSFIFVEMLS